MTKKIKRKKYKRKSVVLTKKQAKKTMKKIAKQSVSVNKPKKRKVEKRFKFTELD